MAAIQVGSSVGESVALPSLRQVARRAVPQIVDGALLPLSLFLVVYQLAGLIPAMVAGLGWSGFAISRRIARSRRIPSIVILGAGMLVVRSTLVATTGSAFLYFLQPTIGTAVVALAFLLSVIAGRPLSRRFAGDFITLPGHLFREAHVHDFFVRNSMMWALIGVFNSVHRVLASHHRATSDVRRHADHALHPRHRPCGRGLAAVVRTGDEPISPRHRGPVGPRLRLPGHHSTGRNLTHAFRWSVVQRGVPGLTSERHTQNPKEFEAMPIPVVAAGVSIVLGSVLYIVLLATLGVFSIRKGHWIMFIIGSFVPLFWLIGALLPRTSRSRP